MKKSVFMFLSILLTVVLVTLAACSSKTTTTTTTTKTTTTTAIITTTVQTTFPVNFPTLPMVNSTVPLYGDTGVHINDLIVVTFSKNMDPATINTNTFTLSQGTTRINGTVSFNGIVADFDPNADLTPNTTYTASITTGAKDLAGNALPSAYTWQFTTGTTDTSAPAITNTIPADGDTGVATNNSIEAFFSDELDPSTVNTTTFTLMQGTTPVAGTVTYNGQDAAIFNPSSDLSPNTDYTANITTGVTDSAGNPMANAFSWTFTTGVPQTSVPSVISTVPSGGASGVPINNAVSVTFSEPMDPMTITDATFTLWQGKTLIPGTVDFDGVSTAVFTPASDLDMNATYTAAVSTDVTDIAGIHLASVISWQFTTGIADTTVPAVVYTSPADGNTGVQVNSPIIVTFTEPIDPTSITVTLMQGTNIVESMVSWDATLKTMTMTPANSLTSNTQYTAGISGATDLAGNGNVTASWSFTTAP